MTITIAAVSIIAFIWTYLESRHQEDRTMMEAFGDACVAVIFSNLLVIAVSLFILLIKIVQWKLLNM